MRLFHIQKINEFNEKQKEEMEKAKGKNNMGSSNKIHKPNISPSSTYNF